MQHRLCRSFAYLYLHGTGNRSTENTGDQPEFVMHRQLLYSVGVSVLVLTFSDRNATRIRLIGWGKFLRLSVCLFGAAG